MGMKNIKAWIKPLPYSPVGVVERVVFDKVGVLDLGRVLDCKGVKGRDLTSTEDFHFLDELREDCSPVIYLRTRQ